MDGVAAEMGSASHTAAPCKANASRGAGVAKCGGKENPPMNNALQTADLPKVISPRAHAVLDYTVAATFFAMGARFRSRNPRASALAFVNGAMVLGVSLLTDYPGGVWRKISFKDHGKADAMQAGLAGLGPVLFGFGDTPEATFFYGQAASEVGVIAATDWDAAA
jgi:hypothetical protein